MGAVVPVEEVAVAGERWMAARVRELERELAELRQVHQREREYFAQLEAIIDHAPLAIYLKDAENRYLLVNREYERLSNSTRSEILGRTDPDLFPEPVAQLFREQDDEVAKRSEPIEFQETIPLPDGIHSFITSKFPLRSSQGEHLGVAGVCTEITELLQAKLNLEQAQLELIKRERLAALGELSAVIAHEVRNPLCTIFNAVASLRRQSAGDAQSELLLGVIAEEADRLNRMVGSLLELARPPELDLVACDLEELAADAIEAARLVVGGSEAVRLEVPNDLPPVRADGRKLRQALVNLVTNALQAANRRAPVVVRVNETEGRLEFYVIDDGDGVPPALVDRVFEPFFTTRAAGTGLGLAVVQRIARAHGGNARVVETPGGGATFVLQVPVANAGTSAAEAVR